MGKRDRFGAGDGIGSGQAALVAAHILASRPSVSGMGCNHCS